MAKGELQGYPEFNWPGLKELLTANDSLKNFTVKNQYVTVQFSDVTNQRYADSVKKVYELGLMKGSEGKLIPMGLSLWQLRSLPGSHYDRKERP